MPLSLFRYSRPGDVDHRVNVSRRTFLQALATGTAIAAYPMAALASRPQRRPFNFIVVSDTHLGYRDQTAAERRWQQTVTGLAKAPGAFVIHLGDVVDGGRESQYPIYRRIRQRVGKPVHEIPGNHDPADLFARHIRRQIDATVEYDRFRFLLLNNARRESHNGFLTERQIGWIDAQCRDATRRDKLIIVCMHVPIHTNRHPDRGWYVHPQDGQTAFYRVMQRHRDRILALFHGHFHNGIRGWEDHAPVHEIVFPSALYNLDRRLMQQRAPGYNLNEFRPGFTLVTIAGTQMHLRYHPVGARPSVERRCPLRQLEN